MTQIGRQVSVNDILQTVLEEQHALDLRPRDVALLVLIRHQIESRADLSFSVEEAELRALANRVDSLDVRDASGTEKRLTESLNRLLRADCLARADLHRLRNAGDTEYQLTSLGENIAAWHIEHTHFTGEPLAAILRAFNSQLVEIAERARELDSQEEWRTKVLLQMQHVLKDMLVSIQRHQRELDRQHEALRAFIPTLLTEHSEVSISRCEAQLSQVIRTIDDLQEVTLTASSKAYELLDQILTDGIDKQIEGAELVCQDIGRRLQSIAQWTTQRAADWVEHHGVVHDFLRSVIRVDRQRRITDALKRAIAAPPTWALSVPHAPRLLRMRDDIRRQDRQRYAPRRSRKDYIQETEEIVDDDIPQRFQTLLQQRGGNGDVKWTDLIRAVVEQGISPESIVPHLPWLMGHLLEAGCIVNADRDWVSITDSMRTEELRIALHDVLR